SVVAALKDSVAGRVKGRSVDAPTQLVLGAPGKNVAAQSRGELPTTTRLLKPTPGARGTGWHVSAPSSLRIVPCPCAWRTVTPGRAEMLKKKVSTISGVVSPFTRIFTVRDVCSGGKVTVPVRAT